MKGIIQTIIEINPCPFCNSKANVFNVQAENRLGMRAYAAIKKHVECMRNGSKFCHFKGPLRGSVKGAVVAWNKIQLIP